MADFTPINTMSVRMNVEMTADGNIAQSGDTTAATKSMSINGISAAANLSDASTVFNAYYGDIAGGNFDSLSAKRTLTGGVTE